MARGIAPITNCVSVIGKSVSLSLLLMLTIATSAAAAETIRFAPLPALSEATIAQQFQPFARYLSKVTQQPVKLISFQSYQSLIENLADDKIDLAYLGPLPYVLLSQKGIEFIPLVRFVNDKGISSYTCSLVAFEKKIALGRISARTPIALTQPYSTCGYLMTEHLLQKHGLSLEQLPYYYAQKHSTAALDVIRGKAAAAGIKTPVARSYSHLGLHIVEQGQELPEHLIVANPRTLSSATIEKIRSNLLSLAPRHNSVDQETTQDWGKTFRHGAIPATEEDYGHIKELLDTIHIPGVSQ